MMNGSPDPCSDADNHSAQAITVVIGANASLLQR